MSLIKQIINIKKTIFKKNEDGFFNLLEEKVDLIKENEEQEKAILKAEQQAQQTEVNNNDTTQQQISFYKIQELFKDFKSLKPAFNYKNIKTNSFDAMLTGREVYEELGINVYNAGSFSPFVREFVLLSNKIGCFFISMLNLTYQSWMYRQNPLIDKIISYFLIKGFSNIHIENINDKNEEEEEDDEDENIKKANVLLQKNNQVIFDALLQAEKYGGSYIVIDKEDLKNYNKYDLKDKKSNSFTFKDNQEYNKNNVITILGSLKPDNEQDKKLLKGWSFGWFDRYWNDWLYCMKKKAVINEILNKQQMCFVYSDHLKDKNDFNKSGFLAQEIVDKTSSMTNNSVMSFRKDDRVEMLQSNVDLQRLYDLFINEIVINFSVPRDYLINNDNHNSLSSNMKEEPQGALDIVAQKVQHYKPFIEDIVKKILQDKDCFSKYKLSFEPPEVFNEKERLENENLKADLELKKAQTREIIARFGEDDEEDTTIE